MAVKNLQTLITCVASNQGVRVTGTECKGTLPADGKYPVHFLFLLWHPLPGSYAIRTGPDARFAEDNAAMAEAIQRTGRSAVRTGVSQSTRLARSVSRTVLSTRSSSTSRSFHLLARDAKPQRSPMNESARKQGRLAIRETNLVRG